MTTRLEAYEKRARAVKLANTYLRKSESMLHMELPLDPSYQDLLDQALETAYEIVRKLPDDFFEEGMVEDILGLLGGRSFPHNSSDAPLERAVKLVAEIERRRGGAVRLRKIEALENVVGRTPEEAELYRAKAAEMREEVGCRDS